MLQRLRPTTRLSLAIALLGWLLLQVALPAFANVPALPDLDRTLLLLVAAAVPVGTWLLVTFVPDADVPPESLEFLVLVASLGFAATLVLRWARTPHPNAAAGAG
jgi:RsiW-degrading membrane proteinase PrsW (M82 family)